MEQLIRSFDDTTAICVMRTFATARSRRGDCETAWSADLRNALAVSAGLSAGSTATVADGDLAREALLLAAQDPDNQAPLSALIAGSPPERFLDPATLAIGVAALVVLQTHVKFERTKDGKFSLKIEKKPLPLELMKKLLAYFAANSSGSH